MCVQTLPLFFNNLNILSEHIMCTTTYINVL